MTAIEEQRKQLTAFLTTCPPRQITAALWRSYLEMKKQEMDR
ncbi:hypothetical protein DFP77_107139 [Marinomonas foliarum]|uniref:Uncharacterized protein n=1 Tax=Marinomonas foliarum TaxID=491950 RepID=A0A369ACH0_9GAMM|nr:hypothetical protein DFP77_107139 [Marinomonas foliarum]